MQPEIEKLWEAVDKVMNNRFIDSATNEGISVLESEYGITPKIRDLDTRKFVLLTKWHENPLNSYRCVYNKLESLCGEENFHMSITGFNLYVELALEISEKYDAVVKMLKEIVPANIVITVQIMYNKHDALKGFTHTELKAFTHERLRKEVFI